MASNQIYTVRAMIDSDGAGLDETSISLPTDPTSNVVAELIRLELEVSGSISIGTDTFQQAGLSKSAVDGVDYHIDDNNIICVMGFKSYLTTSGAAIVNPVQVYDFLPRVALVAASSINAFAYSSAGNPNYHFRLYYALTKVSSQELIALLS